MMFLDGVDVSLKNPAQRRVANMGFIPEERNGHAAVPSMSLAENALLTSHSLVELVRRGVLDLSSMKAKAGAIAKDFDVRLPEANPLASSLSGGNLQKFVVGREIIKGAKSVDRVAAHMGVDVGAAVFIRRAMLDLAAKGSAIVMISQDLEEIFAISHRIAVLHDGVLSDAEPAGNLTAEKVGLLMGGSHAVGGISV